MQLYGAHGLGSVSENSDDGTKHVMDELIPAHHAFVGHLNGGCLLESPGAMLSCPTRALN